MRKALIIGLMLAAALSLAACGKPQTDPPEPADISAPTDASASSAAPAPPAAIDPAPEELPGDGSNHDSPDGTGASSAPAGAEVDPEEDGPEPPDPPQPLPEDGGEDLEEEAQQPDPAGSPDNKADGSVVSKELIPLIRAYLSSQKGEDQQAGAGGNPADFSGGLGDYQEYLDQIRSAEELRETAETLFPGVSDYDIDWDAAWQALEASRSG